MGQTLGYSLGWRMTGAEIPIGMMIIGGGLDAYGKIKSGAAQADAERAQAALKNEQATELMSREALNEGIMQEDADRTKLSATAAFAAQGGEGAGIGDRIYIQQQTQRAITNSQRDAAFKAKMLRAGAEIDTKLASDAMTAGYIGAASSLFSVGGSVYKAYAPPKTPSKLPGLPDG